MTLAIKLDDTYMLRSDPSQIILVKRSLAKTGKNTGRVVEKSIGFYSNVENAINGYVFRKVNDDPHKITNLKDYVDQIKQLRASVYKILEVQA